MEGMQLNVDGRYLPEALDWGFDHIPNELHGLQHAKAVETRQKRLDKEEEDGPVAAEAMSHRRDVGGDLSCEGLKSRSPETFAAMFCSRFDDETEGERLENVFASESYNTELGSSAEKDNLDECGKDWLEGKLDLDAGSD
ncbi:hypothetical protein GUITHDRAFT_156443, partial [Guillardia theta CCMP2712]